MKKAKEFFIKKQDLGTISCWYHGFFYNKHETRTYVTVLLPLAPIARFLRGMYLHCKFGNHDLRDFYNRQIELRKNKN
jgi:hypothetical protein